MNKRAKNLIILLGVCFFLSPSLSNAQVTLTVGDGSGYRGSDNNPVAVSLTNMADRVKRVQVDVCDADDYLDLLRCDTTSRSSAGFTCQAVSLPSGCARIVLAAPAGGIIDQGTGDIFTLRYNVDAGAPGGASRALDPVNLFVISEFDDSLTATPLSGNFTFTSCTAGTQCEDVLYCNGTEGCSGGVCTHTGDPCPGSECDTCQEETDSCFDPFGTPCSDDGLYCNGDEICNGSGSCGHAGSPCPNATCVEVDDECTCGAGENCEDGNFCNGGDLCLQGVCVHTGDPCPSKGLYCDAEVNRCTCRENGDCDDGNICTDDSCGLDGSCRFNDNEDDCDDGIYCNGIDTCGCGTCNHSGDPCSSSQACDEDGGFCGSSEVDLLVGIGSGYIGTIDREVNIQIRNSQSVKAMEFDVCDENDYLIASSCSVSSSFAADFDCGVFEQENGCAYVVLTPKGSNPDPIPPSSSYRTVLSVGYDVGLCVTQGTPGIVDECGIECFDEGATCSASSPDCYRFNRNQFANCQPPPGFTCYVLNDPCLPVDTGDVWLTIENALANDTFNDPLRVLPTSGPFPNFEISCDQHADCDSGSVCSNDTCSGGSCSHSPSGLTTCDDGLYCTDTDRCQGIECIGEGDTCGSIFLCDESADECSSCTDDSDCDGVIDVSDNCEETPNGPVGGVCTAGTVGEPCLEHCDCGVSSGYCSLTQEDSYPPAGNNLGDTCDCEGNFDCDADVDGSDAQFFKNDFGRSGYSDPCTNSNPCKGDFECDEDVDGSDAQIFKSDFGRSQYQDPCPACDAGQAWCNY